MPALRAQKLNEACACESVGAPELATFYSRAPVFVSATHARQMSDVISAIHRVVALRGFQDAVLADAPAIAKFDPGTQGVFAGFDFHVGADGPKLIEINTNAGGAFLNSAARDAQLACCTAASDYLSRLPTRRALEEQIVAMFRREWALAGNTRPLQTVAIVDTVDRT